MAYGRTSMNIFLIVVIILVLLLGGAYLFMRFGLPRIISSAVSNPESGLLDARERQELNEAASEILTLLESYGLERDDAIAEIQEISQDEFESMWNSFRANPPADPGDAAVFAVQELGIEGVDTASLRADISQAVSPQEYREFIESEDLARIEGAALGFMFPVFRDALVELLKAGD